MAMWIFCRRWKFNNRETRWSQWKYNRRRSTNQYMSRMPDFRTEHHKSYVKFSTPKENSTKSRVWTNVQRENDRWQHKCQKPVTWFTEKIATGYEKFPTLNGNLTQKIDLETQITRKRLTSLWTPRREETPQKCHDQPEYVSWGIFLHLGKFNFQPKGANQLAARN